MKVEELYGLISERLKGLVSGIALTRQGQPSIMIPASRTLEAAQLLKEIGLDHVKSVTAIDHPEQNSIDVVYHVSSFADLELAKMVLEIRTTVDRSQPKLDSLVAVWPSIEFLERETTDLMGITFEGQKATARLLLPEGFEGVPPLRRDFAIRTEGIEA